MKAAVFTEYGGPEVLHLAELETPIPRPGEIRIRVRAVKVGFGDLMARNFRAVTPASFSMPVPLLIPSRLMFGLRRPRNPVLGAELSGVVDAVGEGVTRFAVGDEVLAYRGPKMGGNAEYLCVPERGMVTHKPARLSWEQAAALPYGATNALSMFRGLGIRPGVKVLINGASGSVGSNAVQLARHWGAEVTGVCGTRRVELVRQLGAHHVIDYTREDFTRGEATYDVIIDVLRKSSFERCRRVLSPQGRYVLVSFKLRHLWQMLVTSRRDGPRVLCVLSRETPEDLEEVRRLAEEGVLTPVVDRAFPLDRAADAHRALEAGDRSAFIVLTVP